MEVFLDLLGLWPGFHTKLSQRRTHRPKRITKGHISFKNIVSLHSLLKVIFKMVSGSYSKNFIYVSICVSSPCDHKVPHAAFLVPSRRLNRLGTASCLWQEVRLLPWPNQSLRPKPLCLGKSPLSNSSVGEKQMEKYIKTVCFVLQDVE